jgi:transposase
MNETPRAAGSARAGGALRLDRAPRALDGERKDERSATLRPDPEVPAKGKRRQFTNEFKRRILAEAERCGPGEIAALLRREGLYSSHLASWRASRDRGELGSATPKKRGPKPKAVDPSAKRIADLEREIAKLKARAERAEFLVEMQKKMAALLGRPASEEDPS